MNTVISWPQTRIKMVTTKIGSGKTPTGGSAVYEESGVLFLRSQNIHFDGIRLDDVAFINDETDREMSGSRVHTNDSLLNITGASLGRVARVTADLPQANVNQHVCIVRPSHSIDAHYLSWCLAGDHAQQQIRALQVGGNRDGLNFEQVGNLSIPLPPLDEQRRIANFLDTEISRTDALIGARTAQTHCLQQLWEARLADVVNSLKNKHSLVPLRRISISIEQGWSPQCDDAVADHDEWAVLKTSAVSSGRFDPLQHKRLPLSLGADTRHQIVDGDILMTRGSGSPRHVGVAAIARTNGRKLLLSDLLYRVRLSAEWSPGFTVWMLGSQPVRDSMSLLFRGQSGQTIKLRADDIRSIEIPAVPVIQQDDIAKRLDSGYEDVQTAISGITVSSNLLAERRQALITAAVTGQIDVTTARGLSDVDGVAV